MKKEVIVALLLCLTSAYALTPTNPGDLNADFVVNILDVNLVTGCLGQSAATCQSGRADPNDDGTVNIFDFIAVSRYWGSDYSTPPYVETCGNTYCNATAGETCTTCSADCGACPNPCGNGNIDAGEQCDGANLNGATCISRGFSGGTLSCNSACQYVTTSCTSNPPSSGTLCANEPSGMTVISNRAFNSKVENGWLDRGDAAFSIVTDAGTDAGAPSPQSTPSVGQARFQGAIGGSGPINTYIDLTSKPNTLYFCFQNQFSSNFYGADIAGINKMFHIWDVHGSVVVLSAQGKAMNALSPQMRLQNIKVGPNIPSFNINPTLNGTPFQRGQWQQVEVLLVLNTPGQLDGEIHWWVDGSKKGAKTDVGYLAAGDSGGWRVVSWNPTYGSGFPNGTKDVVPAPQYQWIDHWYVSGR